MKEYLKANYELITVSNEHTVCVDWIEVPDGAVKAVEQYVVGRPVVFINESGKYWSIINKKWCAIEGVNNREVLWKRSETKHTVQEAGMKYDSDKPRYSLLPKGAVNAVIDVLEFGAKKYDADNWQKVDNAKERYYNAAMRHIDKWWNGEKHDPETNIHHLAHASTNLFFLMWFDK